MNIFKKHLGVLIAILLLHGYASAGEIVDQVYQKKTFEGSKDRQYSVFLPEGHDSGDELPLVVVLHGCKQTHQDIMNDTRFNDLAEAVKFIVVYPIFTSYDGQRNTNCKGILVRK